MSIPIMIKWDPEAAVYIAISDAIGLALESESYDTLLRRVRDAVPELLELNHFAAESTITIETEARRLACA